MASGYICRVSVSVQTLYSCKYARTHAHTDAKTHIQTCQATHAHIHNNMHRHIHTSSAVVILWSISICRQLLLHMFHSPSGSVESLTFVLTSAVSITTFVSKRTSEAGRPRVVPHRQPQGSCCISTSLLAIWNAHACAQDTDSSKSETHTHICKHIHTNMQEEKG